MIYSLIGIFRRTPSGTYFYRSPCVMNKWCFFYTAFALILYTPQLAAATRNKYGIGVIMNINWFCKYFLKTLFILKFKIDLNISLCWYTLWSCCYSDNNSFMSMGKYERLPKTTSVSIQNLNFHLILFI